jgi:hypothetical protein
LQNPGAGYVQAYVRFASDMPDDVIMTLDQEFIDGVISPFHISGGDWMALVDVQVRVFYGSPPGRAPRCMVSPAPLATGKSKALERDCSQTSGIC